MLNMSSWRKYMSFWHKLWYTECRHIYDIIGRNSVETYEFSRAFDLGSLQVSPVHVRIERLQPYIAAHTHSRSSYEIHYTRSGQGTVTVDGQTWRVTPDALYITGPGVVHMQASDPNAPVVEYCLYLNCRCAAHVPVDPFRLFAETTFWMGSDGGRIYPLITALIDENRHPRPGVREMSEALIRQIIIRLMRMYTEKDIALPMSDDSLEQPAAVAPPNASASRVDKAREGEYTGAPLLTRAGMMLIVEDAFFYRYRTLTLAELAALIHLSERQTQRVIKENFGKTFSQKLTDARMAAASQFLMRTSLSITDISERLGFSSIEHFSSAFRRFMGVSPRQYRQRHAAHPHG